MRRRLAGRGFVVGACLLAFLSAGCTPDNPPAAPPSSSAPSPTPTENAQEREERLAYEAAEKSYREFRAEFYRVLGKGGSKAATAKMKSTASGPYLKYFTELARAYKGEGARATGTEFARYVRPQGYSASSLVLDVCEDSTGVRDFDRSGKQTGQGELRAARLEIRKIDGIWKVWDGTGKKVSSCD